MSEQFYRNIAALREAGTACLAPRPERQNLDAWVLEQLAARAHEQIFRIGCDSNEQTLTLARMLKPEGSILVVERSYRALTTLSARSQEECLERAIRFLYLDLDDLAGHVRPETMYRVFSGPTLAQIRRPQAVFRAIREALRPGGLFFFYGPARKNLLEVRHLYARLSGDLRESREVTFVEQTGLPHAQDTFAQVEATRIEYPLHFTSPDELYACWRESDFYATSLDHEFRQACLHYFQCHTAFETAHRFIGIRARKG